MSTDLRVEDITDFQWSKIRELREKLGAKLLEETPLFDDNFSMLRWLIGWDYKIGKEFFKYMLQCFYYRIYSTNPPYFLTHKK